MDNRSVLLVSTTLEGMDDVSPVQRREKRSATKSAIFCPTVVKLYNKGMRGDRLDHKLSAHFL